MRLALLGAAFACDGAGPAHVGMHVGAAHHEPRRKGAEVGTVSAGPYAALHARHADARITAGFAFTQARKTRVDARLKGGV